MTASAVDRQIRSLRPPKSYVDPYKAHGSLLEEERRPDGRIERTLTVFLAGAECPFTCSFCDLWRLTIDGPTPPGALTRQLRTVIEALDGSQLDRLKLYNASNFFDRRAVPPEDLEGIDQRFIAQIPEFESAIDFRRQVELLGLALDRLKKSKRTVLELFYTHDYSIPEIAKIQNRSVSAVKMDLARSRQSLARIVRSLAIKKSR